MHIVLNYCTTPEPHLSTRQLDNLCRDTRCGYVCVRQYIFYYIIKCEYICHASNLLKPSQMTKYYLKSKITLTLSHAARL